VISPVARRKDNAGFGTMLRTDTPAGTPGDQAEPTIASELDTFNVALNKQLQVIIYAV
jgi:hypothetical protein